MIQKSFSIQKSVRYVTIGEPSTKVKNLWICLHGYGQLAVWFARNFNHLESENRFFVIPEGPHRFYLQGTGGRVGASWMTKEDRIADIEDQFNYLENLVEELCAKLPADCKIHVFGFSQGVATALRWIDKSALPVSSVVSWAGTFPPDIDYKLQAEKFTRIKFHTCFGNADEFISTENAQKLLEQIVEQGIAVKPHFYNGGHKLYADLLNEIFLSCEAV